MRYLPLAICLLSVSAAFGFDAKEWDARELAMAGEAARVEREYGIYAARVKTPAEDVTIPFETFDSGEVKAKVIARRAQFFRDVGYVWAEDIVVEQYKEDGSLDFSMQARHCLVDRPHKCCWISGHARAVHRKTVLEGDDAFYCSSNSFLKVMSNAKVVSEDVKMKGLRL